MTISQLAAELNLTPQALYHHIKKLLEGEMVEVVREERIGISSKATTERPLKISFSPTEK